MNVQEFIFSEKKTRRLQRHGLFWIVFAIHVYTFRFYVTKSADLFSGATYMLRLVDTLLFLPVSFFYAYFALYVLLPHYILNKKYYSLLLILCGMGIIAVLFSWWLSALFDIKLVWDVPLRRPGLVSKSDFILNNVIVYPLTVSGFAIGIKMGKNFYLEQQQNEQLARQKVNADVQLLKNRVYPRFLFKSLKTIHHDMLGSAVQSPAMLLKLAELLSYILYETNGGVPLRKELEQVKYYTELEQTGRADTLAVRMNDGLKENPGVFIEPLLLLPLVEFVFEILDNYPGHSFVLTVTAHMEAPNFLFSLHVTTVTKSKWGPPLPGTKLLSMEQRLVAQYPGRHTLGVTVEENALSVVLRLEPNLAKQQNN